MFGVWDGEECVSFYGKYQTEAGPRVGPTPGVRVHHARLRFGDEAVFEERLKLMSLETCDTRERVKKAHIVPRRDSL